jgi:hypothetical protein
MLLHLVKPFERTRPLLLSMIVAIVVLEPFVVEVSRLLPLELLLLAVVPQSRPQLSSARPPAAPVGSSVHTTATATGVLATVGATAGQAGALARRKGSSFGLAGSGGAAAAATATAATASDRRRGRGYAAHAAADE